MLFMFVRFSLAVAPKTVKNFLSLCEGSEGYGYAGTEIYRVVAGLTIQGGAIGSSKGNSGKSIYGGSFEPENYAVRHSMAGIVSMAHSLDGLVDSRFLIQTKDDAGYLDGRYVAFGRVLEGMSLFYHLESLGSKGTQNRPQQKTVIVSSGRLS
mmetsp:Transcript_2998/g.5295  ORF Transcript_2998/g.5295 Transcript_2998/m.5295 type:complete len:153 (+) Transcript_2998:2551-3009(+)